METKPFARALERIQERKAAYARRPQDFISRSLDLSGIDLTPDDLAELINLERDFFLTLEDLDLTARRLETLPKEIGDLKELKKLNLSNNKLKELPHWIGGLEKLEKLDLSDNELEELPHWIGGLKKLEKLDLSNNKLKELPHWIGGLENLKKFYLLNNEFETLPKEIGDLKKLIVLDLSYNKLATLPDRIIHLTKLKKLDLSYNKLETLPKEIGGLGALEHFSIHHNKITALPNEIVNLRRLKSFLALNNQIREVPEGIQNQHNCRFHFGNNPLTAETISFLTTCQNVLYNMAAHDSNVNYQTILEQLPRELQDKINNLVIENEDLQELLSKVGASSLYSTSRETTMEMLTLLLSDLANSDSTDRQNLLAKIKTALGDCATPVIDFLIAYYVSRKPGNIALLEKLAVQDLIRKHPSIQGKNEQAEMVNALLNALFLEGSEFNENNPCRISKERNCSPSFTRYIKFGFNSITHDIALAFAKLVCKTNPDGSLVVNSDGHYIRDDDKIKIITDWYLRSIGHISEAYKLVQRFEQEYTVLLKDKYPNLVIKNSEEHRWLLDTKGLQNDLASKINPNDAPEGWAEVYNEFMKGLIKNLDKASGQQLLQPMEHGGYQQPYSYPAGSPYPNAAGSSYLGSNLLQTNATTQSNQTTHGANLNGGSSNGGLGM